MGSFYETPCPYTLTGANAERAKFVLKRTINIDTFYLFKYIRLFDNVWDVTQSVYQMLFRNVYELKKWLVDVRGKTLPTVLSMNGESITQMADISNNYRQQLHN